MTTKQIAEATGKSVRTVQDWIKSLSAKSASISARSASSSPARPSDYTMAETCQIIEQGLGKAAADTYRTNAANAEMAKAAQKIKPLNGKQTEYLYRLYHEKALSPYQVQLLLGVATPRRDLLPEVPISPIEADKFFRQLGRIVKNGQPQLELLETAVDSRGQGKGATR